MLKITFSAALSMLLITSCSAPKELAAPDYFPLEAGRYADFKVEKITYPAGSEDQKHTFSLRVTSTGPVTSSDGQAIYTLQYATKSQTGAWLPDSAHAAWRTLDKFIEQENGQPIVKAILPLYEHAKWNCRTYSNAPGSFSTAKSVGKPYFSATQTFDQTATIVRQNDSTLLSKKQYIEIYAANIGLIRRERVNLQYCIDPSCRGKGIVESGWREIIELEKTGKQ